MFLPVAVKFLILILAERLRFCDFGSPEGEVASEQLHEDGILVKVLNDLWRLRKPDPSHTPFEVLTNLIEKD